MAVFTSITNYILNQVFGYQDANEIKENTNYLKERHEIDHSASSGRHKDTINLGDDTNTNKEIVARIVAANKPKIRYNFTTLKWEISNDGSAFQNLVGKNEIGWFEIPVFVSGSRFRTDKDYLPTRLKVFWNGRAVKGSYIIEVDADEFEFTVAWKDAFNGGADINTTEDLVEVLYIVNE